MALAARLSEDNDKTVCVLEAGGANLNDVALCTFSGPGCSRYSIDRLV